MIDPSARPDVRAFLDFLKTLPGQKAYELPLPEARASSPTGASATCREVWSMAVR